MLRQPPRHQEYFFIALAILLSPAALLSSPVVPGPIRYYSTIKSIGIEWDVTGDTNHNAACTVQYRAQGAAAWKDFLPLFRDDFRGWDGTDSADRRYDMLAGSVMFLDSATTYEVKLSMTDPDGGGKDTTLTIATRPVPAIPTDGRTLHVAPGAGGGDGSAGNPYKGLAAAQSAAQPGDVVLVHAGNYGNFSFNKPGAAPGYIVWKAAGDGDAVLDYGRIAGHDIWLCGLKFVNSQAQTYALVGQSGSTANVVTRCSFTGFNYNITMQEGSDDWYIADNTIVGDKIDPRVVGDFGGEGIELMHTSGHTVCFNSITRTADGISYTSRNCDLYNNDIFDVVDDGIEPDYGYANVRVWCNRITNPRNHGLSFQPMFCGPWYFIRNQIMGEGNYFLKYRVVDRFLLAHNTFVGWNTLNIFDQNVLYGMSRNNLWVQAGGTGYIWEAMPCTDAGGCTQPERWTPDWRTSVDYDGFDPAVNSAAPVFKWFDPAQRFNSLSAFATATGIETHAIAVDKADLFDSLFSLGPDSMYDRHCLTLRPGSAAIDKGVIIAGINQDYKGGAPDLGAYESGAPLPWYGPRPENGNPVISNLGAGRRTPMTVSLAYSGHDRGVIIRFCSPDKGDAEAEIYDLSGRQVAKLAGYANSGETKSLVWKGRTKGVYILKLMHGKNGYSGRFAVR
ncbi:MAG TPA: right-handed parallel beta-helix repeat-containing protein [Chitinivibrionales bacterium]|nr:right-handed parallel beta-helix repeat-containing protein [Chitinivibrionales bacterium]